MQSVEQRARNLNAQYKKDNNLPYQPATVVVRTVNGISSIYDPTIPGNVWVSGQSSNGLGLPPSVRPPQSQGIDLKPGRKVRLEYDAQGQLFIAAIDTRGALASGQPAVPSPPPVTAAQTSIQTLAVIPSSPPSLVLSVRAWNPIINNTAYRFPGATITLSAPSAGQMYYALICVKGDYLTLEVLYSTQRGVTDVPLDNADEQECLNAKTPDSTAVWAQKLVGGQTAISQADLDVDGIPRQQLVNATSSATQPDIIQIQVFA
jgi:hypothetical protein